MSTYSVTIVRDDEQAIASVPVVDADTLVLILSLLVTQPEEDSEEDEDPLLAAIEEANENGEVFGDRRLKGQRTCSYCNEKKHTVKTCPKKRTDERTISESSTAEKLPSCDPLTEREFKDMQQAKKDGLGSLDFANEINVPLSEVNKAWSVSDYSYYRNHR